MPNLETAKLEKLLDTINEAVISINSQNKVTTFNKVAEEFLEVRKEDIVGKELKNLPIQSGEVTLSSGKVVAIEKDEIVLEDGKKEYLITLTDITEIKRLQQLKDEFLSVASHELRTPMTIIKSYLWMIGTEKHGPLTHQQKEYIKKAILSTERMIALINDILNISRIEQGDMKLDISRVEIVEVINELLIDFRLKASEKGIRLEHEPKASKIYVYTDTQKLREIIVNLVGNAIKFTQKGNVVVTLEDGQTHAKVSISDTGIGLKPNDLKRLFHKFERLDNSYQKVAEAGGTGLGLFIVKLFVEKMGGEVGVKSAGQGKGSTFWFTLPKEDLQQSKIPVKK